MRTLSLLLLLSLAAGSLAAKCTAPNFTCLDGK